MNTYNTKQAELAKKRRAMYYKHYLANGKDLRKLARKYKVTYERMRQHIRKAEKDD